MGADEHRYEPLRQPPDPVDLRRHPPGSPQCARVRGWMRDFADGELPPELIAEVEDHVHGCRTCALALARSEHEVMRLRRSLGPVRPRGPKPGFAKRTVARLLAEEGIRSEAADAAGAAAGAAPVRAAPVRAASASGGAAGTTGSAGPGGPAGSSGSSVPGRIAAATKPRSWAGLAAVAFSLGAALAMTPTSMWESLQATVGSFLAQDVVTVEQSARLVVLSADDGWVADGAGWREVQGGEHLRDGDAVELGGSRRDGSATLQYFPAGSTSPAAQLELHGRGPLRLQDGIMVLDSGSMRVDTTQAMRVRLGDGSQVDLGVGRYHVDVIESLSFDAAMKEAIEEHQVRFEVQDGQQATIRRGKEVVTLPVGEAVRYREWPAQFDPVPPRNVLAGALGRGMRDPVDAEGDVVNVVGNVYERTSAPSVGSQVLLNFLGDQRPGFAVVGTDLNGSFCYSGAREITGSFAVVQCMPPQDRMDLGITAPDAYTMFGSASSVRFAQPFVLEPSPAVEGSLVGPDDRPRMGGRVVPCIYDEAFGLLLTWAEAVTSTDAVGRFRLTRLPTRLPPHQTLGILVLHSTLQPRFVPLPLPGTPASSMVDLRLRLAPLHAVNVLVEPHAECVILEELPDLPAASAARLHTATADHRGLVVGLQVGRGRLWRRMGPENRPQLVPLIAFPQTPLLHPSTQDPPRDQSTVFRNLLPLPGTDYLLAREYRHQEFHAPGPAALEWRAMDDLIGRVVPGAQLFALSPAPEGVRVRFLGIQDGYSQSQLRSELEANELQVVALGADGSVGRFRAQEYTGGGRLRELVCAAPGLARVGGELQPQGTSNPVLLLEFVPEPVPDFGCQPRLYRYATAADGWLVDRLPPGSYEVRTSLGRTVRTEIERGATALLR